MELFDYLQHHSAAQCAKRLLGCQLQRITSQGVMCVRIVETEAYHAKDAASHSYRGQTPRNSVMFGPSGHLYVYFTYGMHYCINVVTGEPGNGAAVLIRAVEPLEGEELMQINRSYKRGVILTNGPAKLAQALGIDKRHNGHDLTKPPIQLIEQPVLKPVKIITATRIGIRYNSSAQLRFYLQGSEYISRVV